MVVVPSEHALSTADVYAEADRLGLTRPTLPVYADEGVNDLQDAARALCPSIDDSLAALREVGAGMAMVSGSGPTVFGTFPSVGEARTAAERIPGALPVIPVQAAYGAVRIVR
jgi:4-diphosphocytidyl-2-C-methyl-D-erythritol kinase